MTAANGRVGEEVGRGMGDAGSGTYVLCLRASTEGQVTVGRLGRCRMPAGSYLYVGSAFGPGGLRARVGRHVRRTGRRHWHIDYLRPLLAVREVWYASDDGRWECEWAAGLRALPGAEIPVRGFGASDCGCPTHLVRFATPPEVETFRRRVVGRRPDRPAVRRVDPARFGG